MIGRHPIPMPDTPVCHCDRVTIGIICAIPLELNHLREALNHTDHQQLAHARFDTGTLDGHDVVLVGAGIGKVNTSVVATLLADRFSCRAIVFSGVAGGLNPQLSIGDVVIADRVIQHDAGVIEDGQLQTYQSGHLPFCDPVDHLGYPIDPELLSRVSARLQDVRLPRLSAAAGGQERIPQIVYGTVLSGDQYLHCEATRNRLHLEFDAAAIEMEGGALAQVAESFDIPWLVVRALSDLAGAESRLDFATFATEVASSSAAILRRLLPVL